MSNISYGISRGMFFKESDIYCPYCGHIQVDSWECLPDHQEDWGSADCEDCGKGFSLKYEHVYTTKRNEE